MLNYWNEITNTWAKKVVFFCHWPQQASLISQNVLHHILLFYKSQEKLMVDRLMRKLQLWAKWIFAAQIIQILGKIFHLVTACTQTWKSNQHLSLWICGLNIELFISKSMRIWGLIYACAMSLNTNMGHNTPSMKA